LSNREAAIRTQSFALGVLAYLAAKQVFMRNLLSVLLIMLFAVGNLAAKDRASEHATVKGKHISITYGRPNKKGRAIFGGLVPYGEVWRTGADEATEITIDQACTFGGKPLKPGTYTLFTKPTKGEWTIILNAKLGQWGAYEYDKVKNQDVLSTSVPSKHLDKEVDTFTITVKDDGLMLEWDQTGVMIPVKF
jgi:Protein of unknown function (DUF2911)